MNKTISDLITELLKFEDKSQPLCVTASTDMSCPDEGDNFIDASGVHHVTVNMVDGSVVVKVGDSGKRTIEQVIDDLKKAEKQSAEVKLKIGYIDGSKMIDFNDNPVVHRYVKHCAVIEDDEFWNIELGAAV